MQAAKVKVGRDQQLVYQAAAISAARTRDLQLHSYQEAERATVCSWQLLLFHSILLSLLAVLLLLHKQQTTCHAFF